MSDPDTIRGRTDSASSLCPTRTLSAAGQIPLAVCVRPGHYPRLDRFRCTCDTRDRFLSWPRVSFRLRKKFPTSGIIPELGIQFPMPGNSSELLPDIGKRFPMSGNSFRYRKTVSDVGEQLPISENGFRCRENVSGIGKRFPMSGNSPDSRMSENLFRCRKTISDIEKRFTLSGNISIALNRSAQSKRADYNIDLVKSA